MALFKIFGKKKSKSYKRKIKAKSEKMVKKERRRKITHKKPKVKKLVKSKKTIKKIKRPEIIAKKKVIKEKKIKVSKVKPEKKPLFKKMPDEESYGLLKRYRIKLPTYAFCKSEKELITSLKKIGFPCVMKVSGDIIHKTDVSGVRIDIKTEENAVKTFNELMKIKGCKKVLVQKMITEGYEIIVGGRKDPQFDRVIALGAGGIFTEFLKDVSFRVPPLNKEDAEDMLNEVRFSDLILKGFRGQKPANKEAIIDTILAVSKIMEKNPKIKEIDINPLFATSENAIAADIRIILE
jgi:hypothetical protein